MGNAQNNPQDKYNHRLRPERRGEVLSRQSWFVGLSVLAAALVLAISLYSIVRIQDAVRVELSSLLNSTLENTVSRLRDWERMRRRDLEVWATTPDIVSLAGVLVSYGDTAPPLMHKEAERLLMPALRAWDGKAYSVVGLDGRVLTSSEPKDIGQKSAITLVPGFSERILAGQSHVSTPTHRSSVYVPEDIMAPKHDETAAHCIFVGAPVRIEGGGVIAILVFELDPTADFSDIFASGRGRQTMETFAFSKAGMLLSESRFNAELIRIGMIDEGEHSILNIPMRARGVDLTVQDKGPVAAIDHTKWPLSEMVKSAEQGHLGTNLKGYSSYMGHKVIGSWVWAGDMGLGVATEMRVEEAYATYFTTRWQILAASILAACLLVGLSVIFYTGRRRIGAGARRLQAIMDSVLDGIVVINEAGIVETFNASATRIFGYRADEVIGNNVSMLVPEPHRSVHDSYIQKLITSDQEDILDVGREVTGQRKDGTLFALDLAVTEMEIHGRKLFLGITRDITERKEADRLKSEFVSTVSHELRTPLTSIHGSLGLLVSGVAGQVNEQCSTLLEVAHKNSNRLVHLIDDILDVEKLDAGKMVFAMERHLVDDLLFHALEVNKAYADSFDVVLHCSSTVPEATIRVDQDRFAQVMANLISNATKFSPPNAQVDVRAQQFGDLIRFSVTDHGPGIPGQFQDRIFNRFSQADGSDTRQKGGTGLGLSICKAIVEKMGGEIGFLTPEGGGTTFYFELKRSKANFYASQS